MPRHEPCHSTRLSKLATDNTSGEQDGVRVSEETTGVRNDLPDVEARTSVCACGGVDASPEGTGLAAVGDTTAVRSYGVGKGDTRWARDALGGLVDVGSSECGG
jgi:hypothetical protein